MNLRQRHHRWIGVLCALVACVLVSGTTTLAQRSLGEVIDDTLITGKIKASFAADPQVSALAIDVDTANGVVTLTGVVDSENERQRAIQLAQGIEGVQRVEANNLRLRAGTRTMREGEHALRGTITAIDPRTGVLRLRTSAGELTIPFPPPSVQDLKEGDTLTVYVAFEKEGAGR
jgi:BON domain